MIGSNCIRFCQRLPTKSGFWRGIVVSSITSDAGGRTVRRAGVIFLALLFLTETAFAAVLLAATSAPSGDPTVGLLPSDRDFYVNWSKAGLLSVGGIPSSTTQCGSTLTPSGGDDTRAINSAIRSCPVRTCPSGKYISFGSGTFLINAAGTPIQLNKCVVLRGQGPGVTILHASDGAKLSPPGGTNATGTHDAPIIQAGGSASIKQTTALTADGAQGSSSIQVSSATGFSVGDLVLVDEVANGQSMPDCCFNNGTGQVWAEPDYRVEWNNHSPTVAFYDSTGVGFSNGNTFSVDSPGGDACAYSIRCGGVNEELHLIASINGKTITFNSPLTLSYRVANTAQAHLYPASSSLVKYAGVENLTMSNGDQGNLVFQACVYCWAKNVESELWLNAGGFAFYSGAFRDQVEMSWVHNAVYPIYGGGGYAVNLTFGASEILFWNNIDMLTNKVEVVRASGSGSVFAYNYMDDAYINLNGNANGGWVETGMNCSHLVGSHGCLFEGNQSFNSDNDITHGNSTHVTWFRNWMTGFRAAFTALDGTLVDDLNNHPGGNGPLRAIGDHAYSYWDSFIGNVAGMSGHVSRWQLRCKSGAADTGCGPGAIYNIGWNDTSVSGSVGDATGLLDHPTTPTGANATITGPGCVSSGTNCAWVRDGNYDYKTNSIQWASNDTAHTLPNSFFLTSAPTFFSAGSGYPWPWVTPNAGSPLQSGPSGCGGRCSGLPAKARWDNGTPFTQP